MKAFRPNFTCCFFGHRKTKETEDLKERVYHAVEDLICNKGVDTFLFGSKSTFDALCLKVVTKCKEKYPHIKRIYVRAEYPDIGESYEAYIKSKYDDSFFPERLRRAGRAVYVERNAEMIRLSRYCIIYRNEECLPLARKSGTELAFDRAKRQRKVIILFE